MSLSCRGILITRMLTTTSCAVACSSAVSILKSIQPLFIPKAVAYLSFLNSEMIQINVQRIARREQGAARDHVRVVPWHAGELQERQAGQCHHNVSGRHRPCYMLRVNAKWLHSCANGHSPTPLEPCAASLECPHLATS
eukprot:1256391-Amphidinium_carterae.1